MIEIKFFLKLENRWINYRSYNMDNVSKYFFLSSILDDDIYRISFVIRAYHAKEISMSVILKHLEALQLTNYMETIDKVLSLPSDMIIESGNGLVFNSESEYTNYLIGLLNLNNIAYAKFCKAGEVTNLQRGLF